MLLFLIFRCRLSALLQLLVILCFSQFLLCSSMFVNSCKPVKFSRINPILRSTHHVDQGRNLLSLFPQSTSDNSVCFGSVSSNEEEPKHCSEIPGICRTVEAARQQPDEKAHPNNFFRSRREMLQSSILATTLLVSQVGGESTTFIASAMDTADVSTAVEMKDFIDPKGLFQLSVPKRFYTLRRTVKGDLPDEKTGKDGRRGSSIFTAGDMAKAEVIAVERYPAKLLLEEEGIVVNEDDRLDSISTLGKPEAVAQLIMRRRERDRPGQMTRTVIVPDSVQVTDNGKTLQFQTKSDIDVQKPELLMEQMGVDKLTRISTAKATLTSSTENSSLDMFMIVFASALEQDFRGVDGQALQSSVDSFTVTSSPPATL